MKSFVFILVILTVGQLCPAQDIQGSIKPDAPAVSPGSQEEKSQQQTEEEPQPAEKEGSDIPYLALVNTDHRWSSKIAFVIDVSGSMREGNNFSTALFATSAVLKFNPDKLLFRVIAFEANTMVWEGVTYEEDPVQPPPGWSYGCPDAFSRAKHWLQAQGNGATYVVPAMVEAMSDPMPDLTVVLVTDGAFSDDGKKGETLIAAVRERQQARQEQGLPKALITVYGVGKWWKNEENLRKLGEETKGGFIVSKSSISQRNNYRRRGRSVR